MNDPSITALEEMVRIGRAVPLDTKFGSTCDALAVMVAAVLSKAAAIERGESSYAPLPYRKMRPSEWSRRNKRTGESGQTLAQLI
jgi:hypothetical protein